MKKVPRCKYAQPNFFWVDTEKEGRIEVPPNEITTDKRGYWQLTCVRCAYIFKTEDEAWKNMRLFHWCKNPEKCELKEEGDPLSPILSWSAKGQRETLAKGTS